MSAVGVLWLACQLPLAFYFGWTNGNPFVAAGKFVASSYVLGMALVFGPAVLAWVTRGI